MSNTITPTKGTTVNVIPLQTIATAASGAGKLTLPSPVTDARTKFSAMVVVHIGRTATTAFTAATGVRTFVEASYSAPNGTVPTDASEWFTIATRDTGPLPACNTNTMAHAATNGKGDTSSISFTANAAIDYSLASDILYFKNGTVANGEFHKCRFAGTGATAFYIEDDHIRDQTDVVVYNGSSEWVIPVDLAGVQYLRVTIMNNTGLSVDCEAFIVTLDSILVS